MTIKKIEDKILFSTKDIFEILNDEYKKKPRVGLKRIISSDKILQKSILRLNKNISKEDEKLQEHIGSDFFFLWWKIVNKSDKEEILKFLSIQETDEECWKNIEKYLGVTKKDLLVYKLEVSKILGN